jgi:hypothetical protein
MKITASFSAIRVLKESCSVIGAGIHRSYLSKMSDLHNTSRRLRVNVTDKIALYPFGSLPYRTANSQSGIAPFCQFR